MGAGTAEDGVGGGGRRTRLHRPSRGLPQASPRIVSRPCIDRPEGMRLRRVRVRSGVGGPWLASRFSEGPPPRGPSSASRRCFAGALPKSVWILSAHRVPALGRPSRRTTTVPLVRSGVGGPFCASRISAPPPAKGPTIPPPPQARAVLPCRVQHFPWICSSLCVLVLRQSRGAKVTG